jgi:hypothetical protein
MDYVARKQELVIEKMKMDRFFSLYLDKFAKKMDPEKPNTPIWDLYKKKVKEYGTISQEIRNCDYWIAKAVHYG